jgi:4-hydroxybenzoate polyprenyltransferase
VLPGLIRLIHPAPALLVIVATAGMLVAIRPAPDRWPQALLAWLVIVCSQVGVGATNDYVDREHDRAARRTGKPLVAGDVSDRAARNLAIAGWLGVILCALPLPPGALAAALLGAGAALAYDLRLRNTALAWIPYAIAFPTVPLFLALAVDRFSPVLATVSLPGLLVAFALHASNVLPDIETERRTVVARLGARSARLVSVGSLLAGLAVALVIAGLTGLPVAPWLVVLAVAVVGQAAVMQLPLATRSRDVWLFRVQGALAGSAAVIVLATWLPA